MLVNNAGIGAAGTVADNTDEEWHRVFDVNVVGMVRVSRACLPALRESAHASIVNTCSVAATAGLPQRALYSATKGAVLSLTLAMAADHVAEGIRVNCVTPGHGRHALGRPPPRRRRGPGRRARGTERPPADGPPRQRRRGRRGDRLPGLTGGRLDHRHRPRPSTEACRASASANKGV